MRIVVLHHTESLKMNLKEAQKKLKELTRPKADSSNLSVCDFRSDRAVRIEHEDGSIIFFTHAFALSHEEWYFVFTEHNGYHLYHKEDVILYEYREVKTQSTANFEAERK